MSAGERIRTDRFTQASGLTGLVRASEGPAAGVGGTFMTPRPREFIFSANGTANAFLRTAPGGGAVDTDFRGPYYVDNSPATEVHYAVGEANLPNTRDLHYEVVLGTATAWTLEIVTEMR